MSVLEYTAPILADLLMDQMLQIEFQVLLSTINMCFCLLLERRFGRIVMSDSLLALKEKDDNFLICVRLQAVTPHLASSLGMYVTRYNVWIQLVTSYSTQHRAQGVAQQVMGAGAGRGVLEIFVITLNSLPGLTISHLRGANKQMFQW